MGITGLGFKLQKIYSDGAEGEAKVYRLTELPENYDLTRRKFIRVAGMTLGACVPASAIVSLTAGCGRHRAAMRPSFEQIFQDVPCATENCSAKAHRMGVGDIAFSPDGSLLVSGGGHSADTTIKLWAIPSCQLVKTLKEHVSNEVVHQLAYHPDGSLLASSLGDGTIRIMEMPAGKLKRTLSKDEFCARLLFNPHGDILVSKSVGYPIRLWKMPSGELLRILPDKEGREIAISPDGGTIACGGKDRGVRLWEVSSGNLVKELDRQQKDPVNSLCFSPDGELLVAGAGDFQVMIWEFPSTKLLASLQLDRSVHSLGFSPDGKLLAAGTRGYIALWETASRKMIKRLETNNRFEGSLLRISPEGRLMASASNYSIYDGGISLWEMPAATFLTCLFDPQAVSANEKVIRYTKQNEYGQVVTYVLPCGSSIPPSAICTCNCIPGSFNPGSGGMKGGGTMCTCDLICTCVPVK